jgi:uncharacterized protein YndB with AHSA1/START domain
MAEGSSTALSLSLSRVFDAPRPRVFAAWTKAEALKQWFAPGDSTVADASVDFRVGGSYRIHIRGADGKDWIVSGVYREIRPPERLVFTWRWAHDPDMPDTIVTLDLHERGARTEVQLTHDNLPHEDSRKAHEHGWVGCFDKLPLAI